ncbi:phytochrome sensor protein [Aliidiomarina sedimenti]|uniref:Phytochrome sensor protein n=1 Tax=Aliidiomarina sedimenti TaxID=1933879 RepID=A0ABY0BVD8_9GAMM|nr:fimbria/pilus periplasmic chaperone [Aliidiomarina sedimenti]RUO28080.1 phytochrome sensor protein [Aliidiomarina sedimenti]
MKSPATKLQQTGRTGLLVCGSLVLLLVLLLLVPAHASSFTVQPIRAELSANQQVFAMRVRNTSSSDVSIQLDVKQWQQANGHELYTDTDELLAVPPIFTVAANQTQTIRVGLRRAPDPELELSYRLYLRELPPADDHSSGVKMALNIGVPVFVEPTTGSANHQLEWQTLLNNQGRQVISVVNHGNGHAQITRLQASSLSQDFSRSLNDYVLPGASRTWVLPSDFAVSDSSALQLRARVNGNEQSRTVQLD